MSDFPKMEYRFISVAAQIETEPRNALEYVQDVYKGRRTADPWRMRAAIAALQFESPKLQATAIFTRDDFADQLERCIKRSGRGQQVQGKVLALPPPKAQPQKD